ncbi:DUF4139 domain-containing protein [Carboxylicivirga marina]|uniref:Mucoidy inhibitor MuiA family protein n=1 Tax=Carboxylicivirga marina TaxID=2800988 RepID=A0ABS1HGB1_9BACT|nr:DUF4139 domain-containing protein [Carboxylicivirga marina]MBK3516631.1 mucoidy inhibitor MuiA family protein [Carboxylicivirga marina]
MKLLNLILLCLLVETIFANTTFEKEITSSVNEVTVFLKGAQVSRQTTIELSKGVQTLKFTKLSPFVDTKSIQVKANGDLIVLSVNHQQNYLNQVKQSDELNALKEQQKQLNEEQQLQQTYLAIIKEELEFLRTNRNIAGNNAIDLTNLQQTSDYYGKRLTELKLKEIDHNKKIEHLKKEIQNLQQQISALFGVKEFPSGEVLVKVDVKQAGKARFVLSYLVNNAGWFPSYDIRAKNVNEPVQLIYKANVRQDTKVDWKNVKLTFSSSDPKASGVAPQLQTYYLDYNLLPPSYKKAINEVSGRIFDDNNQSLPGANVVVKGTTIGTVSNADGFYSLTIPNKVDYLDYSFIGFDTKTLPITSQNMNVKLTPSQLALDEVVVVGYGSGSDYSKALQGKVAGVSSRAKKEKPIRIRGTNSLAVPTQQIRNQTTLDFKIKQAYSIPADNKNYTVDMDAYELQSSYQYYCVPKLDRDAFLIAQITDWEQYNLLEGEANIFFEDTYIGKTLLDVRFASDTLDISLGRDKQVQVTREKAKDFTTKQYIGTKKQELRVWETIIRNNKSESINMMVLDQIPISTLEEIEVKIEELSKGKYNKETGEVNWQLNMKPSEEKKLQIRYSVKYPKNRNLVIE